MEIRIRNGKSANAVQANVLAIFAVHRIPEEVIADNMPFNSREFRSFAKENNFTVKTFTRLAVNFIMVSKLGYIDNIQDKPKL